MGRILAVTVHRCKMKYPDQINKSHMDFPRLSLFLHGKSESLKNEADPFY
jgi:hypothetical protein